MNTWVTSNAPRYFGRLTGHFDVIIIDAPCSGSGLFRKDEKALTDWTEDNVQLCCDRQRRILTDVWPALKQDGILVYATCSYSTAENETILDWINEEYSITTIEAALQDHWGITKVASPMGMTGYRFLPSKVKGEGFFIAAMRKNDPATPYLHKRFKTAHDIKMAELSGYLLKEGNHICIKTDKEDYSALHPTHEADWLALQKVVYLRKTGLRLGSPAGKDWIPAHEVALSYHSATTLSGIEVTKEQALRFLKREDMGLEHTGKGWQIIKHNGLGLGYIKGLGNRYNNYLPKHMRIRMELES
jgi:NOL1/NOP2/fmu family ribosome biogenesis protein